MRSVQPAACRARVICALWPAGGVLRRFTQSLGVVAATALVVAGVGAGPASAGTQPAAKTMAQWQADIAHLKERGIGCYRASYPVVRWNAGTCGTAPAMPLVPAPPPRSARHAGPAEITNDSDYSAQVPGLISRATGTFHDVRKNITEQGPVDGSGPQIANAFSLQLNSQFFSGSPACAGSSDPSNCQAWQQFAYTYSNASTGAVFMEYWLLNYGPSCPTGWIPFFSDYCEFFTPQVQVNTLTAAQLATVQLTGSARSGGNDSVSMSVGTGQAALVTYSDSVVDLASSWNTTEWGVYGDAGGGEASFGPHTTLQAQTALTSTSSAPPSCIEEGFTGETNNLSLTSTPALGRERTPTMASRQTDGTAGTANCSSAFGTPSYELAFQANTGSLWSVGPSHYGPWNLAMASGTSPSVALMTNGHDEYAYQASTGLLWTVTTAGDTDWNLGMAPGTSPSITALTGGGYQVAFQANTGDLWTVGTAGDTNWGLGMAPGTSPSITALAGGGYQVAYQADTGDLWTVGTTGNTDWGVAMAPGTSPSITTLAGGGYQVALQAGTGLLWTVGTAGNRNWDLGMADGTSPSITALTNGSYEVAFQANTGHLWTVGSDYHGDWGLGMAPGTSPSIIGLAKGSYEVAFQANTGDLWTVGSDYHGDWGLGMASGTSPSITG
jgi:hypothetical protein